MIILFFCFSVFYFLLFLLFTLYFPDIATFSSVSSFKQQGPKFSFFPGSRLLREISGVKFPQVIEAGRREFSFVRLPACLLASPPRVLGGRVCVGRRRRVGIIRGAFKGYVRPRMRFLSPEMITLSPHAHTSRLLLSLSVDVRVLTLSLSRFWGVMVLYVLCNKHL